MSCENLKPCQNSGTCEVSDKNFNVSNEYLFLRILRGKITHASVQVDGQV